MDGVVRNARHFCQVLHCEVDLTVEGKPYGLKRKCCMQHLKADAVMRKGCNGLWRFCFQCGKFQPLELFTGNHRNCEESLLKRQLSTGRKTTGCSRRSSIDSQSSQMTSEEWLKKEQQLSQSSQPLMPLFLPGTPGSVCMLEPEPNRAGQAAEDMRVIWDGCQDVAVNPGVPLSCTLLGSPPAIHKDHSHALPPLGSSEGTICNDSTAGAAAAADVTDQAAYAQLLDDLLLNLGQDVQQKVLHCQVDVSVEGKPYCVKRKCCGQHLKANAVMRKGYDGLWRFCFQCGKFEPLELFSGNHRNCEGSLLKRQISVNAKRGGRSNNDNSGSTNDGHMEGLHALKEEVQKEQQSNACHKQLPALLPGSPGGVSGLQEHDLDLASMEDEEMEDAWNCCKELAAEPAMLLSNSSIPTTPEYMVGLRCFEVTVSEQSAAKDAAAFEDGAATGGDDAAYNQLLDNILHSLGC
eukprot:gene11591-11735_t